MVKIEVGDCARDNNGKHVHAETLLERPVHKLVLLVSEEEEGEDQGFTYLKNCISNLDRLCRSKAGKEVR